MLERTFDDIGPVIVRDLAPEWAVVLYRPGYPDRSTTYHLSYERALNYAQEQAFHYPSWKVLILKPIQRVKKAPNTVGYDVINGTIVERF